MYHRFREDTPFFIRSIVSYSHKSRSQTQERRSLASTSVGAERIPRDEKRLLLSKLVVHFSFTYGVLRGTLYNYRHLSSFIFSNGLMYVNGCVSLSLLYQYFTPLPSNLQLTFTAFSVESFFMLDLFQSSKIVRRVIIFKFT